MMNKSTAGQYEEEYYKKNYGDYELHNPVRKTQFYVQLVRQATSGQERPRVLDVGCAFGHFLSNLPDSFERFGMDVSEFAIGRARTMLPGAKFAVSPLPDIPFDEKFHVITAFDVIEHVPDLGSVAAEFKRRLVPGGHVVFTVPTYDGPTRPAIMLLDKDPTHVHKESRTFWLNWARETFEVQDWYGVFRFLFPLVNYYLHIPTKALRRYTPAITVVARWT